LEWRTGCPRVDLSETSRELPSAEGARYRWRGWAAFRQGYGERVRSEAEARPRHDVNCELKRRQEAELAFWRQSPHEGPGSDSVAQIVHKSVEAAVLVDVLRRYEHDFARARDLLELGGGQGWASCIVKRQFPDASVTLSDLSPEAISSVRTWERVYNVRLDRAVACASYEIPAPDDAFDLVFAFASAHHFAAHRQTFRELHRVLRPGGQALYFYEPSCGPAFYRVAHRRVNRKRPDVPEDVLVHSKLLALAREAGFDASVEFYPTVLARAPGALLYYSVLARLPSLQRVLPCTANFRFRRLIGPGRVASSASRTDRAPL
jgi:SAM-dependent methyltransferase